MKKQVLKLDIDDFGDDSEDLAYLFFHTACPGYVFVDDLNHLYDLALSRENDLDLSTATTTTSGNWTTISSNVPPSAVEWPRIGPQAIK